MRLRTSATSQIIGKQWFSVEKALRAGLSANKVICYFRFALGHLLDLHNHAVFLPAETLARKLSINASAVSDAPHCKKAGRFGDVVRGASDTAV
jgi:hypothetical protein